MTLDKFSDVYKIDPGRLTKDAKGESQAIGLWMFTSDAREPLNDVLNR
jgi:hypothetical protein